MSSGYQRLAGVFAQAAALEEQVRAQAAQLSQMTGEDKGDAYLRWRGVALAEVRATRGESGWQASHVLAAMAPLAADDLAAAGSQ